MHASGEDRSQEFIQKESKNESAQRKKTINVSQGLISCDSTPARSLFW